MIWVKSTLALLLRICYTHPMTTHLKKRVNITTDAAIESALIAAAKRDGVPVTTKATELLRLALELEEDLSLVSIAEHRAKNKPKYIAHDAAWR